MTPALQEVERLKQQLDTAWNTGRSPNLEKCGDLLNKIKVSGIFNYDSIISLFSSNINHFGLNDFFRCR